MRFDVGDTVRVRREYLTPEHPDLLALGAGPLVVSEVRMLGALRFRGRAWPGGGSGYNPEKFELVREA